MTDTDLVTADDSTENHTLSNSVTTDSSAGHDASGSATDANTSASDGSLSTMVLPELRALANRAGVKGTSGMRKNELIAAIRESRQGHANGAPANGGAGSESHNHVAEAPDNHSQATADAATRAGSHEEGSSAEKTDQPTDKPAREDTKIVDLAGNRIGRVTSGGFGPSVGGPVAMGYLDRAHVAEGTAVELLVRGVPRPARVVRLPFIPTRYYRG